MTIYTYTLTADDWDQHEVTCHDFEVEDHTREYARNGITRSVDGDWSETIYQRVSLLRVDPNGQKQVENTIVALDPPEPPCRGESEHDWNDADDNHREECRHCFMGRWVERPHEIVLTTGESVGNRNSRLQCVTYVAHDDERAPKSFMSWIDQTKSVEEGQDIRWKKLIEVRTDGADYLPGAWSEMTEEERDDHDEWVERLHDARVKIADMDPEDREWIESEVEGDDGDDPDVLEAAIEALGSKNEEVA